jgi:hypothetical protein
LVRIILRSRPSGAQEIEVHERGIQSETRAPIEHPPSNRRLANPRRP